MPSVGIVIGDGTRNYPGNLTPYVTVTCIVAAMGGLIFGYDIGISGGVATMESFQKKFFPSVYKKQRNNHDASKYCQFDSFYLTLFTSSLYPAALCSCVVASYFTRKFGRIFSMLVGAIFFSTGALLNGLAEALWMLIVGRLLLGFGIGFTNRYRIHLDLK